ncbi:hypothetical protein F2Q69_00039837 [Brassica cretica]|uniref:PHD finger protein ALFIN-LIKE n=1 Tax=Brassica cretica TaxID=69181 RepID=A0A8S9N7N9_BRACR|nr:hypothetical protein F2Q69_00039837 [Brassica cretica]
MRRRPRQRHPSSSSEFEFNISISPRKASSSLCPADELFYKGQLLPLQLSPRLSLVRTLCSSSSDYTSSSSSAARDSTESSSSTDSTSSFPLLHAPPLDCCDSSRPSSVTDEEDVFFKQTKKSGFSLSRLSSVFKKDTKAVSAAAPSSVKRMSSTAKERGSEPRPKLTKPEPKDEEEEEEEGVEEEEDEDDEQGETQCGACGESYAADEFWICCDLCENWFHGKCVKITPARAEHIKQYKCPSCSNKRARS